MKYDETVACICGDNWKTLEDEKHGGYGVACLLAFMAGVEPNAKSIAEHLSIEEEKIRIAFIKIEKAGLFSRAFDACHDKWLLGLDGDRESQCAWGYVAGIALGHIYRTATSFVANKKE